LGADRIISRILDSIENQNTQHNNYPPFNIIKHSDCETEVQVAVAGFRVDELDVKVENGSLVITGEKYATDENESIEYIYHGISARKFVRSWTLADNVEVMDATVKDGILGVRVKRLIPETAKAKSVPITHQA
jgi:molecular chaperone IbpA